ncbi:hypothetical protein EXM22_10680 [Oceanispirochaeta crateris]|uniref:Lipoprotein n=1 Tax=Oceanispirochaeta crateris TaxID=2518645 RepID=A0A5C1QPD3_9SPIO|nr:hypothetical protein [Oceanispirochaeta crateris]QEN08426.1 hypothetical protein EXM22_10680 [Oceanispirochaeta crateris]
MKQALFPLILLTTVFAGCASVDPYIGEQIIQHQVADISFTFQLLSEDHLKNLYGKTENPFINFPGRFPKKEFFVFDTEISAETTTLDISRSTMSILIGSDVYKASNDFNLTRAWTPYFASDREQLHMKNKINKLLKPANITVSPENPFKGLLVFLVPQSEDIDAVIRIPAVSQEGDEGIIEVPFKVKRMVVGTNGTVEKNTGIFSE